MGTFEWDGLALIERNETKYINEPHPGGGNPVLAINGDSYETIFTDMLGTSLGKVEKNGYSAITKTSFGAESNNVGYVFLFRNYRADMGKWLSQDLIGYPDGWNNFTYCNNCIVANVDYNGLWTVQIGIILFGAGLFDGSVSFGITFGYSPETGFSAGFYESTGGGLDMGFSLGASISGTITGQDSIDALAGTAAVVGASISSTGEGISVGGEANIPGEAHSFDPFGYTLSIGFSLGVPIDIHTFITETTVQKIIQFGGQVTSISE